MKEKEAHNLIPLRRLIFTLSNSFSLIEASFTTFISPILQGRPAFCLVKKKYAPYSTPTNDDQHLPPRPRNLEEAEKMWEWKQTDQSY